MDTGVCVSCGAEDVELNENGECTDCGEMSKEETVEDGEETGQSNIPL